MGSSDPSQDTRSLFVGDSRHTHSFSSYACHDYPIQNIRVAQIFRLAHPVTPPLGHPRANTAGSLSKALPQSGSRKCRIELWANHARSLSEVTGRMQLE